MSVNYCHGHHDQNVIKQTRSVLNDLKLSLLLHSLTSHEVLEVEAAPFARQWIIELIISHFVNLLDHGITGITSHSNQHWAYTWASPRLIQEL